MQDGLRCKPPSCQLSTTGRALSAQWKKKTHLNAGDIKPVVSLQCRETLENRVQLPCFFTSRDCQARNSLTLHISETQLRSQRQEQLRSVRRYCNQRLILCIGTTDLSAAYNRQFHGSLMPINPIHLAIFKHHTASVFFECCPRMRAINSILASLDSSALRRCSPELYSAFSTNQASHYSTPARYRIPHASTYIPKAVASSRAFPVPNSCFLSMFRAVSSFDTSPS